VHRVELPSIAATVASRVDHGGHVVSHNAALEPRIFDVRVSTR
jgi:hypothetical protein